MLKTFCENMIAFTRKFFFMKKIKISIMDNFVTLECNTILGLELIKEMHFPPTSSKMSSECQQRLCSCPNNPGLFMGQDTSHECKSLHKLLDTFL